MNANAAKLAEQLQATATDISWRMWSELGVSGWERPTVTSVIQLEPLIAFTALVGRADRRLLTQAIDWCVTNADLVSLHQLKQVVTLHRWPVKGPIAEFGATVGHFTRRKWPGVRDERPLLRSVPHKSQPPELQRPSLAALRFRAIFGVGSRSEILRHLLFHDWPQRPQAIAQEIPYRERQISKDLRLLTLAGMTRQTDVGGKPGYVLADPGALAALVGEPTATPMPWGDIFRVVTELEDGFRHVAAHNMHAVDTELARRLRLVRPEIARLRRQRWWVEPRSGTVDDVADWVSWLLGEIMRRI